MKGIARSLRLAGVDEKTVTAAQYQTALDEACLKTFEVDAEGGGRFTDVPHAQGTCDRIAATLGLFCAQSYHGEIKFLTPVPKEAGQNLR